MLWVQRAKYVILRDSGYIKIRTNQILLPTHLCGFSCDTVSHHLSCSLFFVLWINGTVILKTRFEFYIQLKKSGFLCFPSKREGQLVHETDFYMYMYSVHCYNYFYIHRKLLVLPTECISSIGCAFFTSNYPYLSIGDNGLNPVWHEPMCFDVVNPECALIRFVVNDVDIFGELNQIGQATYPVRP